MLKLARLASFLLLGLCVLPAYAQGPGGGTLGGGGGGGGGSPTFPVNAQTASYSVVAADFSACKIITMNNAAAQTITLLAAAPANGQCVQIENIGAGALTVARNGLLIDGAASNLTLNQHQGVTIISDGTNYSSQRGIGGAAAVSSVFGRTGAVAAQANDYNFGQLAGGTVAALATFPGGDLFFGGINAQVGTSYTFVASDENKLTTFSNAAAIAVTLPQATTAGFGSGAVFHVRNLGAGTATITPTTSTIDGAANLALTTGQGADIYSDGTNYNSEKGAGGGGSGTVTNIATTAPITGGPITTTGTIACATCATTTSGGPISFDKSATGLINPTADATFTYVAGSTTGLTLAGTAPASVSTTPGTTATTLFNVNGVAGGATSNATGVAGVGSSPTISGGTGGAGTGTNAVGGAGGSVTLTAGNGGASAGTGANSNGGNVALTPGTAGTGGSGAAGLAGVVSVTGGSLAGGIGLTQGTAISAANTNLPANTATFFAPAAVTSYFAEVPAAAPTNNNSGIVFSNANPSVGSFAKMSQTAMVSGTAYTNATTTFTNVVGGAGQTLQFSVDASSNYLITCKILWQGSATTTGPKFQWTGPASPNSVAASMHSPVTTTTYIDATATAFSTSMADTGTITAATNFMAYVTLGVINGANAGTVTLQAAANGAGTLTIQPGSGCLAQ